MPNKESLVFIIKLEGASKLDEARAFFDNIGIASKVVGLFMYTEKLLREFYPHHVDKSWFKKEMIPAFEGKDGILLTLSFKDDNDKRNLYEVTRKGVGATNPAEAEEGTLRALYGVDIMRNFCHASDSKEGCIEDKHVINNNLLFNI